MECKDFSSNHATIPWLYASNVSQGFKQTTPWGWGAPRRLVGELHKNCGGSVDSWSDGQGHPRTRKGQASLGDTINNSIWRKSVSFSCLTHCTDRPVLYLTSDLTQRDPVMCFLGRKGDMDILMFEGVVKNWKKLNQGEFKLFDVGYGGKGSKVCCLVACLQQAQRHWRHKDTSFLLWLLLKNISWKTFFFNDLRMESELHSSYHRHGKLQNWASHLEFLSLCSHPDGTNHLLPQVILKISKRYSGSTRWRLSV